MSKQLKAAYSISAAHKRGYAYAHGFGPFDGFDSLKSLHPAYIQRQKLFWQSNSFGQSGLLIDDYGNKWPDALACSTPPPSCFFSGRIIESLAKRGIHPDQILPVPLGSILSAKLAGVPHPDYYAIAPAVGIAVDYAASGFVTDADGNPDLPRGKEVIVQFDPETWNGQDLFRCSNWPRGGKEFLCTERVRQIAQEDGWTNVEFTKQRIKGISPLPGII